MIIKIPFKTPTINHLYWHKGNMKIMKTEARNLRKEIIGICRDLPLNDIPPIDKPLEVVVEIYENWYCKNGTIKKKDISNKEKFLIDSVFEGINLDDKQIFCHTIIKKQSLEEFSIIKIGVIKNKQTDQSLKLLREPLINELVSRIESAQEDYANLDWLSKDHAIKIIKEVFND